MDEKRVDGAERELARLGASARAADVVEDPRDLGAREVSVDDEARAREDLRGVARALQLVAHVGRAAALPDDGAMNGGAGLLVPDERRLALVGDADPCDVSLRDSCGCECLRHGRLDRLPDVLGVVLDPAGLREVLRELHGGAAERRAVLRDDERGRARRALIDGEQVFGHTEGLSKVVSERERHDGALVVRAAEGLDDGQEDASRDDQIGDG